MRPVGASTRGISQPYLPVIVVGELLAMVALYKLVLCKRTGVFSDHGLRGGLLSFLTVPFLCFQEPLGRQLWWQGVALMLRMTETACVAVAVTRCDKRLLPRFAHGRLPHGGVGCAHILRDDGHCRRHTHQPMFARMRVLPLSCGPRTRRRGHGARLSACEAVGVP